MVNACGSRLMTSTSSTSFRSEKVLSVFSRSIWFSSVRSFSDKAPARRDLPRRNGLTGTMAQSVIGRSLQSLVHRSLIVFYYQDSSSTYWLQVYAYLDS